jgi:hypothetical protein
MVWVAMTFAIARDGLTADLTDERGAHPSGARVQVPWPFPPFSHLWVPDGWLEFVAAARRRQLELPSSRLGFPIEVAPFFIRPPEGTEALDWEESLEGLMSGVGQAVRYSPSGPMRRSLFNMPLDVVAVGNAVATLADLEASSWYRERPEVRDHGLVVTRVLPGELRSRIGARTCDVVVAWNEDWEGVQSAVRSVPVEDHPHGPRLIILLDRTGETHVLPRRFDVPPGVALLVVKHIPVVPVAGFLKDFFYGIFHDLPLHGALRDAVIRHGSEPVRATLFADPHTDHNIRISDALQQVEALRNLSRWDATTGDVEAFLARARRDTSPWDRIEKTLRKAAPVSQRVHQALRNSRDRQVEFIRESRGLVPLAETMAELKLAQVDLSAVRESLQEIVSDPDTANAIAEAQERHVDVALQAYDEAIQSYARVDKRQTLCSHARYRVRVHIGHRAEDSLVVGEPPSIDPLLADLAPDQDGYDLEVALFEKDFDLVSDRVMPLRLPRLGGSRPVYFEIRTRDKQRAAELRVNVYYRNNLLQAFLLTAEVTDAYEWRSEPVLTVALEIATSRAFGNLATTKARAMAIGVNLDEDGVTHRVMIKKDGYASHPLKINDSVAKEQVDRFRSLLRTYTSNADKEPLFPTRPAGTEPAPEFDKAIRALAQVGADICLGIFKEVEKEINTDLAVIRQEQDLILQIVRHRENAVFPWPLLYDYVRPSRDYKNRAPVCRGTPLPDAPPSARDGFEAWRGCPHNPGREVYCVGGFWGFRHRIEQITSGGAASDATLRVDMSAAENAVCLASSVEQAEGAALGDALRREFGDRFVQFPPAEDVNFPEFMWTTSTRPAVLILLSHLSNPDSGDAELRLVPPSAANAVFLTANDVLESNRVREAWKGQPLTLVLLMACETGATTVSTLNNFVSAFKAAGAAAIVGTEAPVYGSLAARFAEDLIEALKGAPPQAQAMPLGQAFRSVINRLLREGNPLGLVFTYCGNADLVLA